MRILFLDESFYPPKGGSDLSMLTLLEKMSSAKYDISAIYLSDKTKTSRVGKIKLNTISRGIESNHNLGLFRLFFLDDKWKRVLSNQINRNRPDVIMTEGNLNPTSINVAVKNNIKTFVFIRSFEYICISSLLGITSPKKHNCLKHSNLRLKLQYPAYKILAKRYEAALNNADLISTNSMFTQKIVKNWFGVNSEMIYPFIKLENYKVKKLYKEKQEYITFVRPWKWKGVEIFLRVADAMPDKKFLAVGKTDKLGELKRRKNITYIPWVKDMKKIYAKTRMMMIPSVWSEPFGRMTVEAMINGIPCIVSNRGGLVEAIDNGKSGIGIDDIWNTQLWTNAISRLDDENYYRKLSKRSKKQAKKFDFKIQYKKFKKVFDKTF